MELDVSVARPGVCSSVVALVAMLIVSDEASVVAEAEVRLVVSRVVSLVA